MSYNLGVPEITLMRALTGTMDGVDVWSGVLTQEAWPAMTAVAAHAPTIAVCQRHQNLAPLSLRLLG